MKTINNLSGIVLKVIILIMAMFFLIIPVVNTFTGFCLITEYDPDSKDFFTLLSILLTPISILIWGMYV